MKWNKKKGKSKEKEKRNNLKYAHSTMHKNKH